MPDTAITSNVTGTVWKIDKRPGDSLRAGDVIMLIESMKMEIPIEAPQAGTLTSLLVHEGDGVSEGQAVAALG
jgi:acetyl-CoA carboxylase biotin carboxyl carrier protein